MTPESELRVRVERGATLLDQAEPRWWKRIERQLEMADCTECVLGQVFGYYFEGLNVVVGSWDHEWSEAHGFRAADGSTEDYPTLDRLWLEAIEARRADPDQYVP